jgi:hypothetical protein
VRSSPSWSKILGLPVRIIVVNWIAHLNFETMADLLTPHWLSLFDRSLNDIWSSTVQVMNIRPLWNQSLHLPGMTVRYCQTSPSRVVIVLKHNCWDWKASKECDAMRCDAMRQITEDDKWHRKSIQITEVSKMRRIQRLYEKDNFFDIYRM